MAKIEIVANLNDLCGESPIWSQDANMLYWLDIVGHRLHKFWSASGHIETVSCAVPLAAIALSSNSSLVAAGAKGVYRLEADLSVSLIANEHEAEPLAINEAVADPRGRLLVGSTFFDGSKHHPLGKLYSIDTNARIAVLDEGFRLANGMGFSPDEKTLYATDSIARLIYAYDYDAEHGTARNKRTIVKVPSNEGLPDGLTVDSEGFIWSAHWFGGCICRYDPDGRRERRIEIPAQQVSSLTFGESDYATVFVTTAAQPDALPFAPAGYSSSANSVGGPLFCFRANVQGRPEYVCHINCDKSSQPSNGNSKTLP